MQFTPGSSWRISMLKNNFALLLIVASLAMLGVPSCNKTGCSNFYWLNYDMTCRVRDSNNGRVLVEYFDLDTNELRLYLQQNGEETPIEHPFGVIQSYGGNIGENVIKFDPTSPENLLVNGENFKIVKKQ
jgi:hypothetical protein